MTDLRKIPCPKCGEAVVEIDFEERTEERLAEAMTCPRCDHRFTLWELYELADKLQNLQEGSED